MSEALLDDRAGHAGLWLEAVAKRCPEHPAVEWGDEVLCYRELEQRCREARSALRGLGLRRGDVVAAWLPNDLRFVELLHAAIGEGIVLLPLNTRLAASELAYQLADSGARLLLHAHGLDASFASLPTVVLAEDEPLAGSLARAADPTRAKPLGTSHQGSVASEAEPPLVVLYTSGTLGRPKGVGLAASNFFASARASQALLGADAQERWLLCMPLFHVGGLSILLRSVLAGTTAVIQRGFDPRAVNRALDERRITGVSLVANMLKRVLDDRGARPAPPQLRCVLLGGGPAPDALLLRALALEFPLAPTYGLTEATSQVATRPPGAPASVPASGLVPLPGTRIRIVGDAGQDCAIGEVGEICVEGPTVMRGYLGQPEASARALRDGWLFTGDLGSLAADGTLTVVDRRSDLIVSGGENVYPAEIESVLCEHEDVVAAGVAGRPDARFGARPVAWLVVREGVDLDPDGLRAFCEQRLARFKLPVRFHAVAELPLNASGKLLRRALQEPEEGE